MGIKAGLSPFSTSSFEVSADPFQPFELPVSKGFDTSALNALMAGTQGQPTVTDSLAQSKPPAFAQPYGNAEGKLFVNGLVFDANDHTKMLESEQYLNAPAFDSPPPGQGWQALDRNAYQAKINSIKDPSLGTLAKKNLGIGVDNLQLLGGYGLELMGATETGRAVQEQQLIDLEMNDPYQREFTEDIDSVETGIDWFVANLAQQGPNLIESLATFLAGYTVGGGQVTGLGAGFVALAGKTKFKTSLKKAIKNRIKNREAGKKFRELTKADQTVLRQASGLSAVIANNYAIGASDIFGEIKDTDPDSARLKAFLGAIPYSLFETAPEVLFASRLLGGIRGRGGIARRFATGAGVGAVAEGTTEASQEALLMGLNPEAEANTPEGMKRLLNAFAAGAGVGMPIGGIANLTRNRKGRDLSGNKEVNLLEEKTKFNDAPIKGEQEELFGTDTPQPTTEVDKRAELEAMIATNNELLNTVVNSTERIELEASNEAIQEEIDAIDSAFILEADEIANAEQDSAFPNIWQQQEAEDQRADSTAPMLDVLGEGQTELFPDAEIQPAVEQRLGGTDEALQAQQRRGIKGINQRDRQIEVMDNPLVTPQYTPEQIEEIAAQNREDIAQKEEQNELQRQQIIAQNAELQRRQEEARKAEDEQERRERANLMLKIIQRRAETQRAEAQQTAEREAKVAAMPKKARLKADAKARKANEERSREEYDKGIEPVETPEETKAVESSEETKSEAEVEAEETWIKLRPKNAESIEYADIPEKFRKYWEAAVETGEATKTNAKLLAKMTKAANAGKKVNKLVKKVTETTGKQKIAAVAVTGKPKVKRQKPEEPEEEVKKKVVKKLKKPTAKKVVKKKVVAKKPTAKKVVKLTTPKELKKPTLTTKQKSFNTANKADPIKKKKKLASATAIGTLYSKLRPESSTVRYSNLDAATQEEFNKAYLGGTLTEELINDIDERGAKSVEKVKVMAAAVAKDETKVEEERAAEQARIDNAAKLKDEVERVWLSQQTPYLEFISASFADFTKTGKKKFEDRISTGEVTLVGQKEKAVDSLLLDQGALPRAITKAMRSVDSPLFKAAMRDVAYLTYIKKSGKKTDVLKGPEFIDYMLNNLKVAQVERDLVADALREVMADNPIEGTALKDHPIAKVIPLTAKQTKTVEKAWGMDKPKQTRAKVEEVEATTPETLINRLDRLKLSGANRRNDASVTEIEGLFNQLTAKELRNTKWRDHNIKDWFADGKLILNQRSFTNSEGQSQQRLAPSTTKVDIKKEGITYADKIKAVAAKPNRTAQLAERKKQGLTPELDNILKEAALIAEQEDTAKAQTESRVQQADEFGLLDQFGTIEDDDMQFFGEHNGHPLRHNVGVSEVNLIAVNFINKLKTSLKPTIDVYHDTAAFIRENKKLFDKAKRTGKFDESTNAMAFHMGNAVVLFSSNIRTEKQVKTILAHEILGHHGLRSVVSKAKLKALLDKFYNTDANIRNIVDHSVTIHHVDKYIAIEEAIADKAMILDTSLLNRIWTMIKNVLNKAGLKFGDELSRYWVGQIRRFVRYGLNDGTFSVEDIQQAMHDMRERGNSIRFMEQHTNAQLGSDFIAMNAQNRVDSLTGGMDGIRDYIQNEPIQRLLRKAGGAKSFLGGTLEALQTLNHKATRSEGLTDLYGFFMAVSNASKNFLDHYQLMTKTQYSAGWWGKPDATKEDKLKAGELLAFTSLYKKKQVTDNQLDKVPDLVVFDETGGVAKDEQAFKQAESFGSMTLNEVRKGIKIAEDGSVWGKKDTAPWLHDESFTEDHIIWRMYLENRNATNQAAIDVLIAEIKGAFAEKTAYIDDLRKLRGATGEHLSREDTEFFHKSLREYFTMRAEASTLEEDTLILDEESKLRANEWLNAIIRGMHNPQKLVDIRASVEKGTGEHGTLFKGRTDILNSVQAIHDKKVTQVQAQKVQHVIQKLFITDNRLANVQIGAKSTIMGSYVQFVRNAKYQIRLQAFLYEDGVKGASIRLSEEMRAQMPYYQVATKEQAASIVNFLDSTISKTSSGKVRVIKVKDVDDQERSVIIEPRWGTAPKQSPSSGSVSYRDIAGLLIRLDIKLTPTQNERIVTATARYESQARKHLMRTGNPGWDKNVLKNIASYLETKAHIAAKSEYRYAIDRLMADESKWRGHRATLVKLANELTDANKLDNEEAKFIAKQRFDTYAYMYRYSADMNVSGIETVKVDGKDIELKLEGRGEYYRDEGRKLIAWYDQTRNIVTSTEDLLSGSLGSQLKLATVTMQLGMSFATAAVNLTSIPLLTIPNLATYNQKRGFGGGFGFSKASAAVGKATSDIKNTKFGTTEFLYDMVKNWDKSKMYNEYGLTLDEAVFLRDETERGTMAPAQMNALLGSSRGGVHSAWAIKGITGWMYAFSQTEQLNRRVSGLAAYRLERDRFMAANPNASTAEIQDYAKTKAGQFVYDSQGNYDMYNRPEIARGNLFQYPMMYKQFTLSAIKLFAQMDVKGRTYAMGLLFLVAGMKGMPFADDIMDLLDTLIQFFGIKMPTIEKAALEIVEDVAPGMGPYFMRGVADRWFGGTISTRLGFGDLFPLTGMLKAGSDPWREAENLFGPVWTTGKGILGTAGQISKYGLEAIGLREGRTDGRTILREMPVTAVRAITDGYTFYTDGMITNAQGKVVSRDMTTWTAFTRLLGFYPSVATAENDIVRMSKQTSDYAKDIRAEFRNAYIKAKIGKDTETMQQVIRDVNNWNAETRGTEFYMRNFLKSANRAYREWNKTTSERFLKSAPKGIRPETKWLMDVFVNE